jgi:hypothetical protein
MGIPVPVEPPVGCYGCLSSMPDFVTAIVDWVSGTFGPQHCVGTLIKSGAGFYSGFVTCPDTGDYYAAVQFCTDLNSAWFDSDCCFGIESFGVGCGSFGETIGSICSYCVEV